MNISTFTVLTSLVLVAGCVSSTKTDKDGSITKNNTGTKDFEVPAITKPKINCSQVPDTIDGNKWIEKHRVCIIDSPSTWSR